MDRRSVKIEIPLPRMPEHRFLRVSLRTVMLAVAAVAMLLGVYNWARNTERALHQSGYFVLIVRSEGGMSTSTERLDDFATLLDLLRSASSNPRRELTVRNTWPPRVWISRPHFTNPGLTESIVIDCSGSPDDPQLNANVNLAIGDSVFIDYRGEATARSEREADWSFDDWIEQIGAPATAQDTE